MSNIPAALGEAYACICDHIRSGNFKKTDFAMSILAGPISWEVPNYIDDGLKWLEGRLCPPNEARSETD